MHSKILLVFIVVLERSLLVLENPSPPLNQLFTFSSS